MMKTVPIVFAFDNNLILPACVCISSLLMNAKEETFYDTSNPQLSSSASFLRLNVLSSLN